jgi:hypothetical protein
LFLSNSKGIFQATCFSLGSSINDITQFNLLTSPQWLLFHKNTQKYVLDG